jgi:hypothetical protein
MRVGESTQSFGHAPRETLRSADKQREAAPVASDGQWVRAGCTAAHSQARLRAISTPISMPATRQKRSPGDVKYRP